MTMREGVLLRLREALEVFEVELSRVGEGDLADRTGDLLVSVLVELGRSGWREARIGAAAGTIVLPPPASLAR